MKRILIIMSVILAPAFTLHAQQGPAPAGYEYVDSLVFTPLSAVDSTLDGRDIFSVMPGGVAVYQNGHVRNAVELKAMNGNGSEVSGYRIRIFFDNSQTARSASETALYRFKTKNPGVSAYRSFDNPYFKVTVGDYRNKSEALSALQGIRREFPSAFIVREKFQYPALENTAAYKVDTLHILRPLQK